MIFDYKLKTTSEEIGSLLLRVEALANLNETIDELFSMMEVGGDSSILESLCPYFGVVWPSARALGETLAEAGEDELRGKRVLEIGCGLAVPSLVAARLGARVTATDFHPDIEEFLRRNMVLNGIESLEYVRRDWQAGEALGEFDWVIGSDILYESQHPGPVAGMLARHVAPGGKVVLADPGRPYLQAFADEMRRLGFGCEVNTRTVRDTPSTKDIFVLDLTRAGRSGGPTPGR